MSEGVAPKFTTELVTQEVLIGQPVTMSCDVIGTPAPDVTWYQVRNVVRFCLNTKNTPQNVHMGTHHTKRVTGVNCTIHKKTCVLFDYKSFNFALDMQNLNKYSFLYETFVHDCTESGKCFHFFCCKQ